jgi:hypothetical protein
MSASHSTTSATADEKTLKRRQSRLRWYHRNREKARAANKEWCAKNAAKLREKRRQQCAIPANRKKCNERWREWRKKNPAKKAVQNKSYRQRRRTHLQEVARRNHLRRKFGITPATYDNLLKLQAGRCAICGQNDPAPHKSLTVDHDHATGDIRGLLCFHCNAGLGHFRDNAQLLDSAIAYLQAPPALVPSAARVPRQRRKISGTNGRSGERQELLWSL